MGGGAARHDAGAKARKALNGAECAGKVTGYDPQRKLYHIQYEDKGIEGFYHSEVKDHLKRAAPAKKRWSQLSSRRKQSNWLSFNLLL